MNKVILGLFGTMVLVVASNAQADNFLPRVLWHNATTGELSAWVLDSHGNITGTEHLSGTCATASGCARDWKVVGTQVFPDHNPGSTADVLWHNATTGELAAWILDLNGTVIRQQPLSWKCATASGCARDWKVVGTGNFHYKGLIDGATMCFGTMRSQANSRPGWWIIMATSRERSVSPGNAMRPRDVRATGNRLESCAIIFQDQCESNRVHKSAGAVARSGWKLMVAYSRVVQKK